MGSQEWVFHQENEEYAAIRDELYLNLIFYIMQLNLNLSYILHPPISCTIIKHNNV